MIKISETLEYNDEKTTFFNSYHTLISICMTSCHITKIVSNSLSRYLFFEKNFFSKKILSINKNIDSWPQTIRIMFWCFLYRPDFPQKSVFFFIFIFMSKLTINIKYAARVLFYSWALQMVVFRKVII